LGFDGVDVPLAWRDVRSGNPDRVGLGAV
jgi:hypothetical protein